MTNELNPIQALFLWRMIAAETMDAREPMKGSATPSIGQDRALLIDNGYLTVDKRPGPSGRSADFLLLTDRAWAWAAESVDVEIAPSEFASPTLQGLLRRLLPFLQRQELPLAALFPVEPPAADVRGEQPAPTKSGNGAAAKTLSSKKVTTKKSAAKAPTKKAATKKSAAKAPTKKAATKKSPAKKITRKAPAKPATKKAATKKSPAKKITKKAPAKKASRNPQKPNVSGRKVGKPASSRAPLAARIESACLALADGQRKERVRLSALRSRLLSVPREELDHELVQMQRAGRLVLYRDDHTSSLTQLDHDAALIVGESPRHLVYLEAK